MGTRPGPVKERIVAFQTGFSGLIRSFVEAAIEEGELDADPVQLTFEINGIILAADASFVLLGDPRTLDVARQVVRRRLGLDTGD
jgi:hypothetical protein